MKKPLNPPNLKDLLTALNPQRIPTVTEAVFASQDQYLHWDDLRYKNPPNGITHDEWWLALKLGRRSQFRTLPLKDSKGKPFVYTLPDEALKKLQYIEKFCNGVAPIPKQLTTPRQRNKYVITSLIEEAITSSQLEGASTSRKIAKAMLETGRQPRNKSEMMILNNYIAMRTVSERQTEVLSENMFLELHRIVSSGTLKDPAMEGALQQPTDERVAVFAPNEKELILHVPPPAHELPKRLKALVKFANEEAEQYLPPVIKAIILHFWVGYDHPFEDGNGRTARALFYWSMLHQGYWLAEFLAVSKILKKAPSKYARSYLLTETDDNDLTYFILYQLTVICKAIDELNAYIKHKSDELKHTQSLMQYAGIFNHRQVDLLSHMLNNSDDIYTIQMYMSKHGVVYETGRKDLTELTEAGLLLKKRRGKQYVFVATKDINERIKNIN